MQSSPDLAVAVNLLWCVPGQVGGSEDYLVRQMLGLREIDAPVRATLFTPHGFAAAHPELAEAFEVVEAPIDGTSRVRRIVAEHRWLAPRTRSSAIVHHGGGTMPLGPSSRRSAPGSTAAPTVLTIHDLQYLDLPQYLGRVKRAYLQQVMPRSARRADVIAVPTEFVRGTVVDAYGIDPERVVVVPHGIEPSLGRAATGAGELRERFSLGDGPVVVLPARTYPHKGHRFLLDVVARHWTDPALRVVLTAGAADAEDDVARRISELGLGDRVRRVGRVAAADRDGLMQLAAAVVFPSEYEGFGAPVIEAMALGVPVICSDRTCLPEVAGGAALVCPLDLDAWADALDDAITRRAELVAAGRARAMHFTTRISAEALVRAYGLALR